MMKFTIINNQTPFVVMEWEMCVKLLEFLPKATLITKFAPDVITEREWRNLSEDDIIRRIFIEFEQG